MVQWSEHCLVTGANGPRFKLGWRQLLVHCTCWLPTQLLARWEQPLSWRTFQYLIVLPQQLVILWLQWAPAYSGGLESSQIKTPPFRSQAGYSNSVTNIEQPTRPIIHALHWPLSFWASLSRWGGINLFQEVCSTYTGSLEISPLTGSILALHDIPGGTTPS